MMAVFHVPVPGHARLAQMWGEALSLTHFLRIVLKGNTLEHVVADLGALVLILGVITALALRLYRTTLD